jgi:EpsI family protein
MTRIRIALILSALMVSASVGAYWSKPEERVRQSGASFDLGRALPLAFGAWRADAAANLQVVNPKTQELIDRIYSQVLTRVYRDDAGHRVMLTVAYGGDQRGELQVHKPEVCYPAQGFNIVSGEDGSIATEFGVIPVRRLLATMPPRVEPLTYWFTMADSAVGSSFDKKMLLIRSRLTGQIPDGLLFRISAVDPDAQRAWEVQEGFVRDLLRAMSADDRRRLSGLGARG